MSRLQHLVFSLDQFSASSLDDLNNFLTKKLFGVNLNEDHYLAIRVIALLLHPDHRIRSLAEEIIIESSRSEFVNIIIECIAKSTMSEDLLRLSSFIAPK